MPEKHHRSTGGQKKTREKREKHEKHEKREIWKFWRMLGPVRTKKLGSGIFLSGQKSADLGIRGSGLHAYYPGPASRLLSGVLLHPAWPNIAQIIGNHGNTFENFTTMSPEDPGEPASAGDLNTVWKKDVHKLGSATCPKCGALIKYGTAGVPNLVRRHLDTQTCQEKAKKRDNQPCKNASLTTWLKKTTAPIGRVLAAVRAPSPVGGASSSPEITRNQSSDPPPPSPALPSRVIQLLDQLRAAVERLPSSVPNADESSPLAVFSGVPAEYVSQDTPVCSLWEELGGYFHKAFDYGAGLDARVRLVTRGPFGLDGTLHFLDYFIREHGLEGGPVELKLEQLIDAVNSVISTMSSRSPRPVVEEVPDEDDLHPRVCLPLDGPIFIGNFSLVLMNLRSNQSCLSIVSESSQQRIGIRNEHLTIQS
ncbi:hypothetical protein B0H10DRAFT_1956063 [Mycena sp. CBHHK59/15]|nr:hypothetical protein B0H10DRAFT_1956063 [Mycena sp. CBHHK59/15]